MISDHGKWVGLDATANKITKGFVNGTSGRKVDSNMYVPRLLGVVPLSIGMVFLGCCSNVVFLELIIK